MFNVLLNNSSAGDILNVTIELYRNPERAGDIP
jgi:hypothetical protein